MARLSSALVVSVVLASPATAAEYLTDVTSQVYQTPGTPREIATRASTCIAQHLRPGTIDALQIISSDLDNGVIVAQSALKYGSFPIWEIRSRFTIEAREGRFRVSQTGLEVFIDVSGSWAPIGKAGNWKKAVAAFTASADSVARCVMAEPKQDDW